MVRRLVRGLKRRMAYLASKGAYHFLVKDWSGVNDIETLQYFFSTEFYWFQMRPMQPNLKKFKRVLVLAPHQDDESMGAGGLLLQLSKLGSTIKVIYTTDGRQSNIGVSVEESLALRNQEAVDALKYINADFEQLDISNFEADIQSRHIHELSNKIIDFKPDLVLTPWLLDIPDFHRVVNHMLVFANQIKPLEFFEIWSYQVHAHLYPNIAVDISNQIDTKIDMIKCFKSQLESFKPYDHIIKGMNAYNSKYIPKSSYAELFFGLPAKEYIQLAKRLYKNAGPNIYRHKKGMAELMSKIEKEFS